MTILGSSLWATHRFYPLKHRHQQNQLDPKPRAGVNRGSHHKDDDVHVTQHSSLSIHLTKNEPTPWPLGRTMDYEVMSLLSTYMAQVSNCIPDNFTNVTWTSWCKPNILTNTTRCKWASGKLDEVLLHTSCVVDGVVGPKKQALQVPTLWKYRKPLWGRNFD